MSTMNRDSTRAAEPFPWRSRPGRKLAAGAIWVVTSIFASAPAPGRIRTCDARFRKGPKGVRGCSPTSQKCGLTRSFVRCRRPPVFAQIRPLSASGVTTALPRSIHDPAVTTRFSRRFGSGGCSNANVDSVFAHGGLRLHSPVRPVPPTPSDLLTSAVLVRPVRLVRPLSRCRRIPCRNRAVPARASIACPRPDGRPGCPHAPGRAGLGRLCRRPTCPRPLFLRSRSARSHGAGAAHRSAQGHLRATCGWPWGDAIRPLAHPMAR